ncbi:MAG: hypothetical protein QGH83_09545 [Candidatus Pacebacteria bacterium]|jgi:hypothetical protein|nr:hypothetical protein [Candidatus Paceibacterota bacterium]
MTTNQLQLREVDLKILFNSHLGQKKMMLGVGEEKKREFLVKINSKWLSGTFYTQPPFPQVLFGPVDWNPSGHELGVAYGWEGIWEVIKYSHI